MTTQPSDSTHNMTSYWKELDVKHHLNPQSNYRELKGKKGGSRIIRAAKGVWLTDSEGKKILDGMAGLWCVQLGYGRRDLVAAAAEQMELLPYYNTFFQTATPPTVELAARLAELAPADCKYVFFGSGGSESNDTFVRLALFYWSIKNQPKRVNFITRNFSYHGSTQVAASLGGLSPMHERFGIPLPGFHHVMAPYAYEHKLDGETDEEFGIRAAGAVEEKILELGADTVAAFLGEPVMGAGGVLVPPPGYWPEVERICRKHDVLFGIDEVITGFGRTGHWFASEMYGISPDTITVAKGISSGYQPLSGLILSERIVNEIMEHNEEFMHGYTYSGHPVACAVGLANIRALDEEKIIERFRTETAPHLEARLHENFDDHPLVGEIRVCGGLAALELVADPAKRTRFDSSRNVGAVCRDHCIRVGLISRAVRNSMVLSPPIVITRDEVDELVGRLRDAVDATALEMLPA